MLSWEAQPFQGARSIMEKLTVCIALSEVVLGGIYSIVQSLPFQKVQHKITTQDAQPASPTNIIVLVTGLLLVRLDIIYSATRYLEF